MMMTFHSDIQQAVRDQALDLPEGSSMRGVCPSCDSSSAFSISRTNNEVAYICFKLGCSCRGVITSRSEDGGDIDQRIIIQRKLFNGTLHALSRAQAAYLIRTFNIEAKWLSQVRYNKDDKRVYYPQLDIIGRVAGYIARYYPALAQNMALKGAKAIWKTTSNRSTELYFPSMKTLELAVNSRSLLLVEDYPSALRINSQLGLACCCLGGTNVYESHISTMAALGIRDLVIVLDADAITKAVKLKRDLSIAFDSVTVIPLLGADPKDMGIDELHNIFKGLI